MKLKHNLSNIAHHFQIYGAFCSAESYGSGHINDTYCAVFNRAGKSTLEIGIKP